MPELYSRITELEDTVRVRPLRAQELTPSRTRDVVFAREASLLTPGQGLEADLAASRSMESKATTTWEVQAQLPVRRPHLPGYISTRCFGQTTAGSTPAGAAERA